MSTSVTAIPLAQWQDEMEKRGKLDCRFVCPACGNEASPNDFKMVGADPQRALQECIGRALPRGESRAAFSKVVDERGKPCDWAAFGLLDICTVHVDLGDKVVPVFAFAEGASS